MNNDVPWIVQMIIAWLPFLALIALAMWITRQVRKCLMTRDGRSLADVFGDLAHETKRATDAKTPTAG